MTAATIALFVSWIGKPDMKPLYTNMEPADAQSLVSRLAQKNIVAEVSADGKTVSVPADKLDASRLEMASQGMPHSGRLGFELFDKVNWGQTEFDEKVNYQRALEGELERTIQTLTGVESARVHLVMPTRFAVCRPPARGQGFGDPQYARTDQPGHADVDRPLGFRAPSTSFVRKTSPSLTPTVASRPAFLNMIRCLRKGIWKKSWPRG